MMRSLELYLRMCMCVRVFFMIFFPCLFLPFNLCTTKWSIIIKFYDTRKSFSSKNVHGTLIYEAIR